MPVLGKKGIFNEKDIFTQKESLISNVIFLPSTCVSDAKSHISTCLCWERKAFFIEKDIFKKEESFISLVICLA